ncbi:MAG: hypothetical protein JXA18_00485 [Chitinispirillaceae bacterium]|nr:hypothetical protein [Chitinispirillaceae bacterium]
MIAGKVNCLLLLGVLFKLSLLSCSTSVSGVETTNGITVVATSESIEGTAPPYAQVYLFDTSYVPFIDSGTGLGTSVDSNGMFMFSVVPGTYNILVIARDGAEARMLQATILADQTEYGGSRKEFLRETGIVNGSVAAGPEEMALVYLAGTSFYRVLTGSASFTFYTVPPGPCILRCARITAKESGDHYAAEIVASISIEVTPGSVTETGAVSLD